MEHAVQVASDYPIPAQDDSKGQSIVKESRASCSARNDSSRILQMTPEPAWIIGIFWIAWKPRFEVQAAAIIPGVRIAFDSLI